VYVITNATNRLSQAGSDLEDTYAAESLNQRDTSNFNEARRQETLSFLKELSGLAIVRSAPGFHAKFLLADPYGKTPSGILTTSNLISFALNRNDEVAVRLNPAEVFTLAEAAHWALSVAESELQPGRITEASNWPAHIPVASQRDELVARRGSDDPLMGQWTDAVRKAQTSIVATNFGWESTHQFVDAMVEAAGRGVRVAAVMKRRNANDAARDALRSAGATVLLRPWMHAKTLLVDDQVFVGTANFTDEDDATCFEVGLRLEGDRAEFVRSVVGSWIDTVDGPGPG
jgi:phosphatidylserine/phosphatidylglycerophosphate/cardiolipin synthase-like enzyme